MSFAGAAILATVIVRITNRHHPRKRMIQYSRALDISWTAVITGYPPARV
jgi:hypothetical protein